MASRKVAIINRLTHTKGPFAGQPFKLRRWVAVLLVVLVQLLALLPAR